MLKLQYVGGDETYLVEFKKISGNVVQVTGELPVKTKGFTLSRIKEDTWRADYTAYKTVYREVPGGVQFSNDGSVYVAPPEPEPTPEPEPYVPTLGEVKTAKIEEMNQLQQNVIQMGIDVTLSDGSIEHFSLTANDQISLMGLQAQVAAGAEQIPWHASDHNKHCKYYTNTDMQLIIMAAMQYVSYHVTYFRDLRIYINSLDNKESVQAVSYGMTIPEEYQSEVLRDMYVTMEG